jgi:histidinol-phosphate aminotransferase
MLKRTIKLNMNEMPFNPPEEVIEAARKALSNLNRYTDPEDIERLRGLLADYSAVPKKHIILGPGSDLLLREAIQTCSKGRKVIVVSPSFFPTVQAAKQFATRLISIRLSPPEFDLDLHFLIDELKEPSLVIIDNPNNPTGKILLDRDAAEAIIENRDALLLIDEAYYEFSGMTFAHMVQNSPNLAITRTMDKAFSLAGARVGYAIAGKAFLEAFSSFYAFIPQSNLEAAAEALKNPDYMKKNIHRIIKERARVMKKLGELDIQVFPSSTNFFLAMTKIPDAVRKLRDIGILISDLSNQLPPGFIRISIGTREENDIFIAGYKKICKASD